MASTKSSGLPFPVNAVDLGNLSQERSHEALAYLLDIARSALETHNTKENYDPEHGDSTRTCCSDLSRVSKHLLSNAGDKTDGTDDKEHSPEPIEAFKWADEGAKLLTSVILRSSPESGLNPSEVEYRREFFGTNALSEKKLDSFCKLCWEASQDFVLAMLIVLGTISIAVEVSMHAGDCATCWIEGAAILCSVVIVVMVTGGIDYAKQFAFIRLTNSLNETNTKQLIRDGKLVSVVDDDIVVGDILCVNSHNLASIPCDCVLLGPVSSELMMNESTLTGESKLIRKKPGDVVLSGTTASSGSGKMVVIAVGVNSVAGRIKARVYESGDKVDDLEGDDENSPLFTKLDDLAKQIGMIGTCAAILAFVFSCIIGLGIKGDNARDIIDYVITAITVLAVAVPEGLPLAVTLALAFSSNKMMKEQNLVKHLESCETMGCATTICTDKTGTLTTNKMSARALYVGKNNFLVDDPGQSLGDYVKSHSGGLNNEVIKMICNNIAIASMNESFLHYKNETSGSRRIVDGGSGNPTEVALLHMAFDLGYDYEQLRNSTRGRAVQGALAASLSEGKQFEFSSARKMMSWAVPLEDGGFRVYTKGAAEVVLSRCNQFLNATNEVKALSDSDLFEIHNASLAYSRRGMRCLALAYRDLPVGFDWEEKSDVIKNSDGSAANVAETALICLALVGIEDPLRPEVPGAIERCYKAGIDVRMVTGDSPNTAVSIAFQAGILRDFHFKEGTTERVSVNLKDNVLMEGKAFRAKVYRTNDQGTKDFDQATFDKIWPHLRVLARSSPDDKLTLAHGLNQSNLFADKETCQKLLFEDKIKIFPDRQVVAMTGDGTNDAPALKRADIGFAMGIAGTQIAKDAADIILLDDNFASIVTAAKWGRNIYSSIQKFLQFQLTVNISAVCTALVGAFAHQRSPLAAIQLLWINLLMDSLASLALASEPPVDALLNKPPVNRTENMITKRMRANMIGQACYQITVIMTLLFKGYKFLDLRPGFEYGRDEEGSVHYTLIFNSFVCMTLVNEINSRKLKGEMNIFQGILDNYLFCGIWLTTFGLQALIVEFGSIAFEVAPSGLSPGMWGLSFLFGLGSLPVQQIINFVYSRAQLHNIKRNEKRLKKAGVLTTTGRPATLRMNSFNRRVSVESIGTM